MVDSGGLLRQNLPDVREAVEVFELDEKLFSFLEVGKRLFNFRKLLEVQMAQHVVPIDEIWLDAHHV